MSWVRIHNRANVPVNVSLSNAGFVYHYQNTVTSYWEFWVAAIGWDFAAVFDCDATKIDPKKGNIVLGVNIGLAVLGTLVTVAGLIVTVLTVGAATPVVLAGVEITGAALTAIKVITGVAAGITAMETIAGIVMVIDASTTVPAQITGLYGGYDYEIYIDGQFVQNVTDGRITITATNPLVASWYNDQTGSKQVVAGYTIP
jgi:hypothetical protein